eukprot:gnl/TRDRNA2_/TRDRNA2_179085_c0_seq1.p1 gnl/TRDRNA2_/TRDRNA2_179085_c0~~gnl/TRDRNA2_/TRDRNA2_179085_c0_seq1.p1  ORF type:complete len:799 (+),score=86.76 gnl/TRDRNA2_/TRDRNA2_179085_c0_seq1:106-2502(+)
MRTLILFSPLHLLTVISLVHAELDSCEDGHCGPDELALLRMPDNEAHAMALNAQSQKKSLIDEKFNDQANKNTMSASSSSKNRRGPGWVPDEELYKECWDLYQFGYTPTLCCPSMDGYGYCSGKIKADSEKCKKGKPGCWGHARTLVRCCPDYGKSKILKPRFIAASSTYALLSTSSTEFGVSFGGGNTVLESTGMSQKLWMSQTKTVTDPFDPTLTQSYSGGSSQWLMYDFKGESIELHRIDVSLQSTHARLGMMPAQFNVEYPSCQAQASKGIAARAPWMDKTKVPPVPGELWVPTSWKVTGYFNLASLLTEYEANHGSDDALTTGLKQAMLILNGTQNLANFNGTRRSELSHTLSSGKWNTRTTKTCERPYDWISSRCSARIEPKKSEPDKWYAEAYHRVWLASTWDTACDTMAVSSVEFMGNETDPGDKLNKDPLATRERNFNAMAAYEVIPIANRTNQLIPTTYYWFMTCMANLPTAINEQTFVMDGKTFTPATTQAGNETFQSEYMEWCTKQAFRHGISFVDASSAASTKHGGGANVLKYFDNTMHAQDGSQDGTHSLLESSAANANSYWQSFPRETSPPRREWLVFDLGSYHTTGVGYVQLNALIVNPNGDADMGLTNSRRPKDINLEIPHTDICGGWYIKEQWRCQRSCEDYEKDIQAGGAAAMSESLEAWANATCLNNSNTDCTANPPTPGQLEICQGDTTSTAKPIPRFEMWDNNATCTMSTTGGRSVFTRYIRLYFINTETKRPNAAEATTMHIHWVKVYTTGNPSWAQGWDVYNSTGNERTKAQMR